MTAILIESEVCIPVRISALMDETGRIQLDTLQAVGFGKQFSRQLFANLPQREENCLLEELRAEHLRSLKETAEALSICAGEDFTK